MYRFTTQTADHVRKTLGLARDTADTFVVFETMAEFAEAMREVWNGKPKRNPNPYLPRWDQKDSWAGGKSPEDNHTMVTAGDLSAVPKSDAMLSKFEALSIVTNGRETIDDVVGAIPNVPAFINGAPLSMRRRSANKDEKAPLAIVVDLVCSAGVDADAMHKRGVAVLALVRALSAVRPVELWLTCGVDPAATDHEGRHTSALWPLIRVDTSPLDLARAAPALTEVGIARNLLYKWSITEYDTRGKWPYSNAGINPWAHLPFLSDILKPAFSHVEHILCIPGVQLNSEWRDPEKWLEERLKEHISSDLNDE